jgi:hypothetical protein
MCFYDINFYDMNFDDMTYSFPELGCFKFNNLLTL